MHYFEVGTMRFPVIGLVERENGNRVPVLEIDMLSDERWQQLAEESAAKNFREWNGQDPESPQEALEGQRAYMENLQEEDDQGSRALPPGDEGKWAGVDTGKIFENLVHLAVKNGITVRFCPLRASYARIKGDRIALNERLDTIEDFNYNLAHELAHSYLHRGKGNITPGAIDEETLAQYEEQADRGARMLLDALAVRRKGGAA